MGRSSFIATSIRLNLPKRSCSSFTPMVGTLRRAGGKEERIPYGKSGSTEKVLMGGLPELGRWVRLEVPTTKMGLKAGAQVTGFAFTQFAGRCTGINSWWKPSWIAKTIRRGRSRYGNPKTSVQESASFQRDCSNWFAARRPSIGQTQKSNT